MSLDEASRYSGPFAHVEKNVKPARLRNKRDSYREKWWIHVEPRPQMRSKLAPLDRFLATTTVSKFRMFAWYELPTLADHQLIAFASRDDVLFGMLSSHPHEIWGLRLGTRLETRPRYTPSTTFETFPFPEPTLLLREQIAVAARELDQLRNNYLNPPEWTREEILEFPGSLDGPWARYVHNPDSHGIGTVRYPRLVPKDEVCAKHLAKRTLNTTSVPPGSTSPIASFWRRAAPATPRRSKN
jgi:hypothetical protein